MENSYRYIDPDFKYTNKNGVLYNLANIENEDVLAVFESLKVSKRLEELYENPIQIIDSESLIYIHRYLFQDVYEWAGKTRTVNISKDGKPFFEGERFETGFKYVNSLITDFKNIEINDKRKIARTLAEILDNVNFLHPFREGNGRTQRELLALEKGFTLNLNPPDNKEIFERYMNGTINSDVEVLSHLIFEIIN